MVNQPHPAPQPQTDVSAIVSRIRLLEERHANMQRKMHLLESNMLQTGRDTRTELKLIQQEVVDMKRTIKEVDETIVRISQSLQDLASREDVRLIERYINLFDPTNFITRNQMRREIRSVLEEQTFKKENS